MVKKKHKYYKYDTSFGLSTVIRHFWPEKKFCYEKCQLLLTAIIKKINLFIFNFFFFFVIIRSAQYNFDYYYVGKLSDLVILSFQGYFYRRRSSKSLLPLKKKLNDVATHKNWVSNDCCFTLNMHSNVRFTYLNIISK